MSRPIIGVARRLKHRQSQLCGIKNDAVDAAISALTAAATPDDFTTAARALDRALMTGHYFVPLFHTDKQWVAH